MGVVLSRIKAIEALIYANGGQPGVANFSALKLVQWFCAHIPHLREHSPEGNNFVKKESQGTLTFPKHTRSRYASLSNVSVFDHN